MNPNEHITTLKKLIQETEQSLAQMKTTVADLEVRRKESAERHAEQLGAGEQSAAKGT